MGNKKLFMLFGSILVVSLCFLGHFTSSVSFNVNLGDNWRILPGNRIEKKISPIHFKNKGNDFGGFIYFGQHLGSGFVAEGIGSTGYECDAQAYGFYYNAQRGDRLWPLDEDTAEKWDMLDDDVLSGEIYTRCRLSGYNNAIESCGNRDNEDEREECETEVKNLFSDQHGYFGKIEHVYSGQKMGLVIGTEYENVSGRVVATGGLDLSLIRIDNKYPVGFIYDYNGGAGFVGCSVNVDMKDVLGNYTGHHRDRNEIFKLNDELTGVKVKDETYLSSNYSCEKVGSAKDTLLSIVVDGIVGMGKSTKNDGYIGNPSSEKTQLFSSVDVNNTQLINRARQKAEILCRGKWNKCDPASGCSEDVVCFSGAADVDTVKFDRGGQTLIIKGGDAVVKPNDGVVRSIFVDSGNLIIQEGVDDVQYVIKNNGFFEDGDDRGSMIENFFTLASLYEWLGHEIIITDYAKLNSLRNNNKDTEDCGVDDEKVICTCGRFDDYTKNVCIYVDKISDRDNYLGEIDLQKVNDMITYGTSNLGDRSSVASVIKGNYIINGSVMGDPTETEDGKLRNKYFIYGKFTTKDTFSDLEKVFTWRCNKGKDTNGKPCLQFDGNPYSNSALTIIDQNYDSPLFN